MAKTTNLLSVYVIEDTDVPYENVGDLDGGFNENATKEFLRMRGEEGYRRLVDRLDELNVRLASIMIDVVENKA